MAHKPDKHKKAKGKSKEKAALAKRKAASAKAEAKKVAKKKKRSSAKVDAVAEAPKVVIKVEGIEASERPAHDEATTAPVVETSPSPEPQHDTGAWSFEVGDPAYDLRARALIARLESDLADHMERSKPVRYLHSISVAHTAEQMALQYGVDPLHARIAGILHDWDKVLTPAEQIALASRLGVNLGVDLHLVQPLLHGLTAAKRLPDLYPELPSCIWQAIARHTIGAVDMTPLDMVLFVADSIEPRRRDVPAIHHVRELVSESAPLEEVYWASFYHGVAYVIDTERYLYPGTLDIYNHLALHRMAPNR